MRIAAMKSLRTWKKVYGFLALVMLGSAVGPSVAMAVDFYVDATKADDTLDGLSPANAERNISAAIADALAAGAGNHIIHVAAGDYTTPGYGSGTQTETLPLNIPNGVKVVSDAGPGSTSIRRLDNFTYLATFFGPLSSSTTGLEGFTLSNNASYGLGVIVMPSAANQIVKATLTNNVISSGWTGLFASGSSSGRVAVTLDSNSIDTLNWGHGIYVPANNGSAVTILMNENTISGAAYHGMYLSASSADLVLSMDGDQVLNSNWDGLFAHASDNGSITGTLNEVTVTSNGNSGIGLSADNLDSNINITVTNSTVSDNGSNGLWASASTSDAQVSLSLTDTTVDSNSGYGIYLQAYWDGHVDLSVDNGSIDGNSSAGLSAYANSTDASIDVTVTNATISNNGDEGLWFSANSSDSHLDLDFTNVTVDGNSGTGIYVYADSNCDSTLDVTNSYITNNSDYGIFLDLSDAVVDANLSNVTVTGNSNDGIYAQASSDEGVMNLMVNNSIINNNGDQGIYVYAYYYGIANATITNSTVNRNNNEGIFVYAYDTGAVAKVDLDNVKVQNGGSHGIGVDNYWYGSRTELNLANSSVTGNDGDGVRLSAYGYLGGAARIEGTQIANNDGDGVYEYSNYAIRNDLLRRNTITGNQNRGVYLSASYYGYNRMTMDHNTISGNMEEGVYAYGSDNAAQIFTMEANTVAGNADEGLYLTASSLGGVLGDIGGGAGLFLPASKGLNTFSGNNSAFHEVLTGDDAGELFATRNWWNNVNTPQAGTEFWDEETGDPLVVIPANTATLQFGVSAPSDGMVSAGESFTLSAQDGTYFVDNVGHQPLRISVQVGGVDATNVALSPDGKTLTGVVGTVSGTGNYDITVTNPAGQTGTLSAGLAAEVAPPAAVLAISVSTARAYPNPVGSDGMTLDMVPAGTIARLYTYTGEMVREMTVDATGSLHWDARNGGGELVASGTYLLLLEANGEKKTLKIGVER